MKGGIFFPNHSLWIFCFFFLLNLFIHSIFTSLIGQTSMPRKYFRFAYGILDLWEILLIKKKDLWEILMIRNWSLTTLFLTCYSPILWMVRALTGWGGGLTFMANPMDTPSIRLYYMSFPWRSIQYTSSKKTLLSLCGQQHGELKWVIILLKE